MKKFLSILMMAIPLLFLSCSDSPDETKNNPPDDAEISIDGSLLADDAWAFYSKDLEEADINADIVFSAKVFVQNTSTSSTNLMWQVNTTKEYPMVAMKSFAKGTTRWTEVKGSVSTTLGASNSFYISTFGVSDFQKINIYMKDFKLIVKTDQGTRTYTADDSSYTAGPQKLSDNNWINDNVDSLYETYKNYFDYFGLAVSNQELQTGVIQKGLQKHTNTITMGNEFKPDSVFAWEWSKVDNSNLIDFTDSYGTTIKVPSKIPSFSTQDLILSKCKELGLKMRGHVLVWYSQTPENFFRQDYKTDGKLVDKETMTARQEWYIKTVIQHVQKWEAENNDGKHIIWAWDVVNEAASDSGTELRKNGNWYGIYKDDSFIVNAFRFANKYADSDVLLCYNDYNCLIESKRTEMLNILNSILKAKDDSVLPSRIDAMGIQAHISVNNTASDFEKAIKAFTAKGLDVQVTELDIATESSYKPATLAKSYGDLFTTLIANRKTETKHGVSSVTIWGINDETTWLNTPSQQQWHGNTTQYPLLFEKNEDGEIVTKAAFDAVIKAAKEYKN